MFQTLITHFVTLEDPLVIPSNLTVYERAYPPPPRPMRAEKPTTSAARWRVIIRGDPLFGDRQSFFPWPGTSKASVCPIPLS